MKSGAGDDPFGDVVAEEREREHDESDPPAAASSESSSEPTDGASAAEPEGLASEDTESQSTADLDLDLDRDLDGDANEIPWILRRRSVKDDRPNVTQFFLRDATDRAERRFRGEVEDRLDTDVYLLDLREAAYVIAMQHPDEVASLLGQWGYDYRD